MDRISNDTKVLLIEPDKLEPFMNCANFNFLERNLPYLIETIASSTEKCCDLDKLLSNYLCQNKKSIITIPPPTLDKVKE